MQLSTVICNYAKFLQEQVIMLLSLGFSYFTILSCSPPLNYFNILHSLLLSWLNFNFKSKWYKMKHLLELEFVSELIHLTLKILIYHLFWSSISILEMKQNSCCTIENGSQKGQCWFREIFIFHPHTQPNFHLLLKTQN